MSKSYPTPEAAILVAVDIAKDHNEVLIELRHNHRRRFRVANTLEEYERLVAYLRQFDTPARVGFEATGNYHRPLAYFLHARSFELRLIPTMALARTREAMHNSWDKNDPKDAQVILHMLKTGLSQTWHDPLVSGTNDAQELSKTHHQVTLARTRVWHRLRNHYFPLYFPEIEHFIRSDHSDWLIQLLLRFPTPGSITSLAAEDFVAQAWSLVGRKVHKAALLAEICDLRAVMDAAGAARVRAESSSCKKKIQSSRSAFSRVSENLAF
jgi:transposase